MKLLKIAILLALFATSAACTVEKTSMLEFNAVGACYQEDSFTEGSDFFYQSEGVFDTVMSAYAGYNSGYIVRASILNTAPSTVGVGAIEGSDPNINYGEGNNMYLKHFDVAFEVPTDWDPIDPIKVPAAITFNPGATALVNVNIMPPAVRQLIDENFANNAYKTYDPFGTLRPPATDANNNPITCTVGNAKEKCNGYPCVVSGNQDPWLANSTGTCSNACTVYSGCAPMCYDPAVDNGQVTADMCFSEKACTPHYGAQDWACDIGPSDLGICRKTCTTNGVGCDPLLDPNSNDTLVEYECINSMCIPKDTTVNPHSPEPLIVKIKAAAKDVEGNWLNSNEFRFTMFACRGCLVDYGLEYCDLDTGIVWSGLEAADLEKGACMARLAVQDWRATCTSYDDCKNGICNHINDLPVTGCP